MNCLKKAAGKKDPDKARHFEGRLTGLPEFKPFAGKLRRPKPRAAPALPLGSRNATPCAATSPIVSSRI